MPWQESGRRSKLAGGIFVVLACLCANPVDAAKRIQVQGRVILESGEGLADWPVQLIATQRFFSFSKFSAGGKVVTVARTRTDADGYFTFDVARKRGYRFWFLRFLDPSTFDTVKYRVPADREITEEIRHGRIASLEETILYHPDWPEVERRIKEAGGEATPQGKILRSLGLPEKSTPLTSGEVEWWYFTKGIVYTVRGSRVVGSRWFEPVTAPPGDTERVAGGENR